MESVSDKGIVCGGTYGAFGIKGAFLLADRPAFKLEEYTIEREGMPMKNYSIPQHIWRALWPALLFLAIQLVTSFAAVTVTTLAMGEDAATGYLAENTLLFVGPSFIISLAVFLPLWRKTKKANPALNDGKPKAALIALTIVLFIAYYLLLSGFSIAFSEPITRLFPEVEQVAANYQGALPVQLLVMVVLAPLVEEFLVRGVILNRLSAWMPTWAAVVVSAAIFGALHMNLYQFIFLTILGSLLGWVYVRTKNLLIPILAHAVNNATNLALQYIVEGTGIVPPAGLIAAIGLVVVVACAILLHRMTRPEPTPEVRQLQDAG